MITDQYLNTVTAGDIHSLGHWDTAWPHGRPGPRLRWRGRGEAWSGRSGRPMAEG